MGALASFLAPPTAADRNTSLRVEAEPEIERGDEVAGGGGLLEPMRDPSPVFRTGERDGRSVLRAARPNCGEFARDSLLEEAGFELSVPPERKAFPRALDRFRRPSVTRRQA